MIRLSIKNWTNAIGITETRPKKDAHKPYLNLKPTTETQQIKKHKINGKKHIKINR